MGKGKRGGGCRLWLNLVEGKGGGAGCSEISHVRVWRGKGSLIRRELLRRVCITARQMVDGSGGSSLQKVLKVHEAKAHNTRYNKITRQALITHRVCLSSCVQLPRSPEDTAKCFGGLQGHTPLRPAQCHTWRATTTKVAVSHRVGQ